MKNFMDRYFWRTMLVGACLGVIFLKTFFNMTIGEAISWMLLRGVILVFIFSLITVPSWIFSMFGYVHGSIEKIALALLALLVFSFFKAYWMETSDALIVSWAVMSMILMLWFGPTENIMNFTDEQDF